MNYFLFFLFNLEQCPNNNRSIPSNICYIISLHITPESKQKCKKKISKYIVFVLCSWQENNIYIYIYAHTQYRVGESKATTARAASFAATVARAASSQKNTKRERKKNNTEKDRKKEQRN